MGRRGDERENDMFIMSLVTIKIITRKYQTTEREIERRDCKNNVINLHILCVLKCWRGYHTCTFIVKNHRFFHSFDN